MAPAFRHRGDAIGFVAFLGVLIVLPALIRLVGLPSREQVWKGVPSALGPVGDLGKTLYEERGDADVVFVGTSPMRAALRPESVEKYLSGRMGRAARIEMLAMWWQSLDIQYVMLNDYLESHRAKLVVLEVPATKSSTSAPHRQLFRWLRYGEYDEALSGLTSRDRASIYSEQVLGGPRQALNLVRPNLIAETEKGAAATEESSIRFRKSGFDGAPYVEDSVDFSPSVAARALSPVTDSRIKQEDDPAGRGEYMTHFLKKIVDLTKRKGVHLALIHFPEYAEFGRSDVPQIVPLKEVFGPDAPIIATPLGDLFFGLSPDRVKNFYYDDHHFNQNGAQAFEQAVLPAIYEAYERA